MVLVVKQLVVPLSHPQSTEASRLLDRVREAIRARHYSLRAEEAHVGRIRRFILFHNKRHPAEMAEAEINHQRDLRDGMGRFYPPEGRRRNNQTKCLDEGLFQAQAIRESKSLQDMLQAT